MMHRTEPDGGSQPRPAESWIEITSRPSTSSLSSAAEDTARPGVRTHHDLTSRRRRRQTQTGPIQFTLARRNSSADGSSQEEYDESESESDRVMSSSNEGLQQALEDEEDEDTQTALAMQNDPQCFTPQPNAFSHPPASASRASEPIPGSYFPASRPSAHRAETARYSHSPYNAVSPSHHADHDAALRASLTTLLSCAAAARGLPKSTKAADTSRQPRAATSRVDPATLRMVPEAVVLGQQGSAPEQTSSSDDNRSPSPAELVRAGNELDRGKRKAGRSSSKDRRQLKKLRRVGVDEVISPTLLTWVASAGILVLVSALSFSAGYAVGRENGRMDAGGLLGPEGDSSLASNGKHVSRAGLGLKRFRWSGSATAVGA